MPKTYKRKIPKLSEPKPFNPQVDSDEEPRLNRFKRFKRFKRFSERDEAEKPIATVIRS